jgi:tetratricopeptide (TPR) repeat protein
MAEFDQLIERGEAAVESGRYADAARLYEEALAWARAHGDAAAVDRAFCGRATVAIEQGSGDAYLSELRQVLVRSRFGPNGFRAAYALARAHELRREAGKAAFYAGIALDHADKLGHREWQAGANNLRANLELTANRFAEASRLYQRALRLWPEGSPVWHALIQENLGYCFVVRGFLAKGFRLLYQSLRTLRRAGATRFEAGPRLSLCFAHLEAGRGTTAARHGERALAIATAAGDREGRKMALYLVGEACKHSGRLDEAREHFGALQREFYPHGPHLPQMLLAIDVRRLLNLKG